jgi:hypothetical protein
MLYPVCLERVSWTAHLIRSFGYCLQKLRHLFGKVNPQSAISVDLLDILSNPLGMSKSIDWDLIDYLAERQGVEYWARRKWRQRQHVPHKWRLAIIMASRGRIKPVDFAEMDRMNREEAA